MWPNPQFPSDFVTFTEENSIKRSNTCATPYIKVIVANDYIEIIVTNLVHVKDFVMLKRCNVNGPLFSVHSYLMCLWDLRKRGVIFVFSRERKFFEENKTRVFLLSWITEAKKPKPFYLIEFSLWEFVISIIVSRLKFVQSFLFAFYTDSASSPL